MPERKKCSSCHTRVRAKRKTTCFECWLRRQPIADQLKQTRTRFLSIPPAYRLSRVPKKDWPVDRRWCSGCQTFVLLRDCRGSRCKACASQVAHASSVERTYGITGEEYAALLKSQNGRCYICQRVPRSRRLAVDHDHETGEVRGLLCSDNERGCNHAILGNIRDLAMAKRIVAYLESPPARRVLKR